jgi:hypothetical protein
MEAESGLPETSRSEILQTFQKFDEQKRGEGRWDDWQSAENRSYAVEHDGQLYPVKEIVSMATGRPNGSFHTNQATSYLKERGFDVVPLQGKRLSAAIEEVFETYLEVRRSRPFSKTDEEGQKLRIWELFEEIGEALEESPPLSQRPHVRVDWSLGRGRWIRWPWIAFRDERLTSTVKEGFYPSISLRPEMSELAIGYTIGLDRARENYGNQVGNAVLRNRAERLRRRSTPLQDAGFLIPDDGRSDGNERIKKVARKYYGEDTRLRDEDLLEDLDALLQTYDRHVSRETTGFPIDIDRSRLNAAVDNIIRPAILERRDLEDNDFEGYHHQKIIPNGTPKLTPEALAESPRESVIGAFRADVNLLSGNWQKSPAIKFLERADPSAIQDEVSNLLYGPEGLADRVKRFIDWGEEREIEDGKTAGLDGTVASYLLFLSDPQQYAFCKTARAYRPAAEALLGEGEVRSDWPERVAHARDFYREALEIFQEEHGDLPFFDLMHVHIAFYLAENEDEEAPWGEGTIETGDPMCLLIRSNVGSDWEDEEGQSYHFGQTVPNYTQVEPGTEFLVDRSFRAGPNRIIAKGQFGDVEETGTGENGREEYRAEYDRYEPILPPRPITGSEESLLEKQEGYRDEHEIRRLSRGAFEELARPPAAWIFQANPDKYDVRGSLDGREGQECTWTVNQYVEDIDIGDRVYLWESGSEGGIVGTAYVTEPVRKRTAFDWEKRFAVEEDLFEGEKKRVVLRIERAVEPPLRRDVLDEKPELQDLSILQFANATNFPVGSGEAETIERLLGTADEIMQGTKGEDRLDGTQDLPPQDLPPEVEEHHDLLREVGQIIFAGPPGTSKTYGAFEVISAMNETYRQGKDPMSAISEARFNGDPEATPTTKAVWDIVQFHQSYGYEDFVSGIEADTIDTEEGRKQLTFNREKRIFLQLVEAAQNHDVPHVLIIDEINRGALGRVFGELILTLEYRNLPVRLPGQKETIEIPENLYLIGTMNTADRNISLVDHALRRRFHFVERLPEAGLLTRYLRQEGIIDEELILGAFKAVQSAFTSESGEYATDARGYSLKDYAVGHTYFMVESTGKLWGRLTRQVIPLLEEYRKEGILTAEHLGEAARNLTDVISGEGSPPELTEWCERYR